MLLVTLAQHVEQVNVLDDLCISSPILLFPTVSCKPQNFEPLSSP